MHIEIAITKDILNESLPLHYRHAPFKQRYIPLLIPVTMVVLGLYQSLSEPATEGGLRWLILIVMTCIGAFYYLWFTYRRNHAGKQMLRGLGENTHYEVEANDDGLTFNLSYTTSQNKWPAFPRAVIGKKMVLLYQQNRAFIIFYESFFANEDFGRFKQLVRRHMHEVSED